MSCHAGDALLHTVTGEANHPSASSALLSAIHLFLLHTPGREGFHGESWLRLLLQILQMLYWGRFRSQTLDSCFQTVIPSGKGRRLMSLSKKRQVVKLASLELHQLLMNDLSSDAMAMLPAQAGLPTYILI